LNVVGEKLASDDKIIKIQAVGDIMLGICSLSSLISDENIPESIIKNPYKIISEINEYFNGDIRFGNLECSISNTYHSYPDKMKPLMMPPPEAVDVLKNMNINVLNITNNHTFDNGFESVNETLVRLTDEGLRCVGLSNKYSEDGICTLYIKNKLVTILGYNLCESGETAVVEDVVCEIQKWKNNSDLLILSLHWGDGFEHMDQPSPSQIELAHMFVDEGADIILGHHSHTLQPVEIYRDKIIAYSLGNFIFDMENKRNIESAMLEVIVNLEDMRMEPRLIPTIQYEGSVIVDELRLGSIENKITKFDQGQPNYNKYYKKSKKTNRQYKFNLILDYIKILNKIPIRTHKDIITRWINKITITTN